MLQIHHHVFLKALSCSLPAILNFNRHAEQWVIVGYPVRIENKKYHRNQLLFNLGFVLKQDANTSRFEPMCRKLGETLKILEVCFSLELIEL